MNTQTRDKLVKEVLEDLNVQSLGVPDPDLHRQLQEYVDELADHVTPFRDAEIADALPRPYQMKLPARAQLDGEMLTCPRVAYVDASKLPGGEWQTSAARGQRLSKVKEGAFVGFHLELDIPGVVTIVRLAVLWRRAR